MGLEVVLSWRDVGLLTSALVSLASLAWLLRTVPRSPLRDAFAVVFAATSLNLVTFPFFWSTADGWYWLGELADNLVGSALAFAIVVWLIDQRGASPPRWLPVPFVAGMVMVTWAWIAWPELRFVVDADLTPHEGAAILFLFENSFEAACAVAFSTLLFRSAVRRDSVSLALAGLGGLWPFFDGFYVAGLMLSGRFDNAIAGLADGRLARELFGLLTLLGCALYYLGVALYIAARGERNRARTVLMCAFGAIAGLAAAFTALLFASRNADWLGATRILMGLTVLAFPVFATLFLLSRSRPARESEVWAMVRKGSLPALMLATFFVVSETAQTFLSGSLGPLVGIIATAPLVLAIAPIQRWGDRFGHVVAPARPQVTTADAEHIYSGQVRHAWKNGRISRPERARLVELRKDLGLTAEQAEQIEERILGP